MRSGADFAVSAGKMGADFAKSAKKLVAMMSKCGMPRMRNRRILLPLLLMSLILTIQIISRQSSSKENSSYSGFIGESIQKLVQFSDNEDLIDPEEILLGTEDSVSVFVEDKSVVMSDKNAEPYWPTSQYKTILMYNPPPFLTWKEGNKPFRNAQCDEYRCFFTQKHSLVKDMQFNAILFSPEKKLKFLPIIANRKSNQTFVFLNLIPPTYASSFKNWNNYFNLTMTYRNDSDIYFPLGKLVPKPSAPKTDAYRKTLITQAGRSTTNLAVGKSKILATASGCKNDYLAKLEEHLTVANFGDCGTKTFKLSYDGNYTDFFRNVSQIYKFFLIPEVFPCSKYVHMLVFEVMKHNMIPVIYGSDVTSVLPEHSFIDARRKSAQELNELLHSLDINDVAYNEYFWWKNHYNVKTFQDTTRDAFCDLCRALHSKEKRSVKDMSRWWYGGEKCRRLVAV